MDPSPLRVTVESFSLNDTDLVTVLFCTIVLNGAGII